MVRSQSRERSHSLPRYERTRTLADSVSLPFDQRIVAIGLGHCNYAYGDEHGENAVVNLAVLQRISLLGIEEELISEVGRMHASGTMPREQRQRIQRLLNEHAAALRDHELALKYSNKDIFQDPFVITTRSSLHRNLLDDAGLSTGFGTLSRPSDRSNPQLPLGYRRPYNSALQTRLFLERFKMALIGGLSLISPMLIMVLHKDLLTTLLTTSISVLIFGFILALYLKSPETVMGVVAAYAAVLVVFVGAQS